jgi:hypothetical protein
MSRQHPFSFALVGILIAAGVALGILLTGCTSPQELVGGGSGCRQPYAGVTGVDRPETSGLSCSAIDSLISTMPSEPETYLTTGDSPPHLLWKCTFYGGEARRVLLRCEHDKRHFSIIKD